MKRRNFFKSLATFIAAPSIIENIDIKEELPIADSHPHFKNFGLFIPKGAVNYHYENNVTMLRGSSQLFTDLAALSPMYYEQVKKKYGTEGYFEMEEQLKNKS